MFLSVALFAVIGYIDHYALLAYHGIDGPILRWIYGFFMKFGPLHQKYLGKLLLLMAIVAAVMLYHPKKIAGKTYTKGVSYLTLGIIFFGAGDVLKVPNIVLYWSSVPCYFLGFLFSLSGSVHLFQVLNVKVRTQLRIMKIPHYFRCKVTRSTKRKNKRSIFVEKRSVWIHECSQVVHKTNRMYHLQPKGACLVQSQVCSDNHSHRKSQGQLLSMSYLYFWHIFAIYLRVAK